MQSRFSPKIYTRHVEVLLSLSSDLKQGVNHLDRFLLISSFFSGLQIKLNSKHYEQNQENADQLYEVNHLHEIHQYHQ